MSKQWPLSWKFGKCKYSPDFFNPGTYSQLPKTLFSFDVETCARQIWRVLSEIGKFCVNGHGLVMSANGKV
jgi:hypothetical protein